METPKPEPTAIAGLSGLSRSGGSVTEDVLRSLHGRKGAIAFREMVDNCAPAGGIWSVVRTLMLAPDWRLKPADESNIAYAEAAFVESCMSDMSHHWKDMVGEQATAYIFGHAESEVTYKLRKGPEQEDDSLRSDYNDGRYGWRCIDLRGQDSIWQWIFDGDRPVAFEQFVTGSTAGRTRAIVPLEKCVHFRLDKTKNNPEGRSGFRSGYRAWYFLKRIEEMEAVGIERDATGMPHMEVPLEYLTASTGSSQSQALAAIKGMLADMRQSEALYAITPPERNPDGTYSGFRLRQYGGETSRKLYDTDKVKKYYQASILMACLAQFLQFGVNEHGSFALADSATNLFTLALSAILSNLRRTLQAQLINPLMRINKVPRALWPELVHTDIEKIDLERLSKFLTAISGVGVDLTRPETQRELTELAGLTPPALDE